MVTVFDIYFLVVGFRSLSLFWRLLFSVSSFLFLVHKNIDYSIYLIRLTNDCII
jgi:hypothetical protein